MLFIVKVLVEPKELSLDALWDIWEKEADAALGAQKAGKIVALYKVFGHWGMGRNMTPTR